MEDLQITANTAQWLTTVFMLVNGVMIPVTAFLIGKFSTRALFLTAMGLFTAGTIVAALAPGFEVFGGQWLAIIGLLIVTVSTFQFTVLTAETSFIYLTVMHAIRMFGVAMVMMPVTTAGLNQLPERLIPHGTAMSNTMRQVSGSIGTALLVTIMTSTALDPHEYGVEGLIRGVNISFIAAGILSLIGVFLSFFLKKAPTKTEGE